MTEHNFKDDSEEELRSKHRQLMDIRETFGYGSAIGKEAADLCVAITDEVRRRGDE